MVAAQSYSSLQANVVCKQLGYSRSIASFSVSTFGLVSNDFSYDDVNCTGTEPTLDDCPHINSEDCSSGEGAGVECA